MITTTRKEYEMAYRAYRKWLQAVNKGTPQHVHLTIFNNIAKCYPTEICAAAINSLMAVKSLGAL